MALLLKRLYNNYFYVMEDLSDPRAKDYAFLNSPIPTFVILFFWTKFVFNWGPEYMKNRPPFDLKRIMIGYNIIQVLINGYLVYTCLSVIHVVDWKCAEIDYSYDFYALKIYMMSVLYYVLKLLDLLDTVFFVLRKKSGHLSFLHTYHHFAMVLAAYMGVKFIGGGHSFYVGFVNCMVHTILYCYYLLTAYDSKYSKLIWLKKFITQAQLAQFAFLTYAFGKLLFVADCKYPKWVVFIFLPQNFFMIILFSDFYIRTYILDPRRKKKLEEEVRKQQELETKN